MAAPRLTTLAIKGLVTTPNEYGVYPEGSCKVLENWRCSALNQWTVIRNRYQIIQSGVTNDRIKRVVALSPGVFITIQSNSSGTTWSIYRNGDSASSFSVNSPLSLSSLFDTGGYLTSMVKRSRCFLNSNLGVLVLDNLNPATAGERVFRAAALPQPGLILVNSAPGTEIPNTVVVSYAALIRRVTPDGYVMASPPTPAVRVFSDTGARWYELWLTWAQTTDFQVGDVAELYRSAGITAADLSVDTGTSMRLVAQVELDASAVSGKIVKIRDHRPMSAPLYETDGVEIYTSPYQDGSLGANLPPPACKALAQWGDYTFFGNLKEDPSWTLDVPAGVMDTAEGGTSASAFVRLNGIGKRSFVGTTSSGSPTVTGISAADIVGLAVGQRWNVGAPFSTTHTIISVGATTITMSANASSSVAGGTFGVVDVLELNGVKLGVYNLADLVGGVAGQLPGFAVYASETLGMWIAHNPYTLGVTMLFTPNRPGVTPTLTVRGTNGQNYSPPIPDINATAKSVGQTARPNFFRWSKQNQPEAVPSANEGIIGAGAIIRFLATTDCLWALCTDGAYRVSGEAGVWRSDLIDPTFIPVAPDACCVLNDVVYAYTSRGICSLAGVQTTLITRGVLDAEFPGQPFTETPLIHLYANPVTEEIMVIFENATQGGDSTTYVYSTLYKQWSTIAFSDNKLTAAASVASSTAGVPNYTVFGAQVSGGPPKTFSWEDNGIAAQALRPLPTLTLQPFYAGDPYTLKRWIDATWIFNVVQATTVAQGVNGESSNASQAQLFAPTPVDSRASIGISRNGAIGPSLQIKALVYASLSDVPPVLKGLSLRYLPLTTQQKFR